MITVWWCIPSGKLTWLAGKWTPLKMHFLLNMWICYCYVSSPKGIYICFLYFFCCCFLWFFPSVWGENGIHQPRRWPSLPCFSFRFVAFKVPKVSILVLGDILDYPGIPLFSSIPWSLTTGHSLRQGNNNFSEPVIWMRSLFCGPWFWFCSRRDFWTSNDFSTTRNFHSFKTVRIWNSWHSRLFFSRGKSCVIYCILPSCISGIQISHEKRSPLSNQYNGMSMSAKMSPY